MSYLSDDEERGQVAMCEYGKAVFGSVREDAPVVCTTHGKVMGENRDGIAVFRGIPYGGSCDGGRRFLPPVPAADWSGIRDCTKNGCYAVQPGADIVNTDDFGPYFTGGHKELFGEQEQSENCLVLNVLTPGIDEKCRPVVVYIHGGGFATGSGTLVLGADSWSREEDLVVVGVNHRLNVFGYLYLGAFDHAYEESGMAGMLDLVLALEWVRDNIASFGGDPAQVTIMGESGGGMKVSTLMAMPKVRGLFAKAIVESGSAPVGRVSKEDGEKTARRLLDALQIPADEWRTLLTLPAERIMRAAAYEENGAWKVLDFGPVADDINLEYRKEDTFAAPEISEHIPLLVGSSEDELAAFLPVHELKVAEEELPARLCEFAGNGEMGTAGSITEDNADAVIRAFRAYDDKNLSATELYVNIASMASFLGGGSFWQALAKAEQKAAPVYLYLIRYDAPHPVHTALRYAWHTADLPLQMRIVLHGECEQLSRRMAHAWAAFIRTGNPSTEELEWPEFTAERKETMVIDEEWRMENDPLKQIHAAQNG